MRNNRHAISKDQSPTHIVMDIVHIKINTSPKETKIGNYQDKTTYNSNEDGKSKN